ncbi:putative sugar phosphate/phosphate translocator [Porphyridium purpureum]|uniref:Putative sugar phosphate/phosphate translocator n=1 Tax=Porphyridium purpureum TaxID=35688 RepID=A0A5J4YV03_PORPP|nr:putative sugar phosphate/phosphate translocator [Porphyridium purpureum]|eukprot:POR3347..scf209_3
MSVFSSSAAKQAGKVVLVMSCMFACSTFLVIYNKWLFTDCSAPRHQSSASCKGFGFPFPLFVTSVHQIVIWAMCVVVIFVLKLVPRPTISHDRYWRVLVPMAILVALDLGLSNASFLSLEASFVEMLKSGGPAVVLIVSVLARVEALELWKVVVILLISSGLALASYGEANFDLKGFLFVMSAMVLGSVRMILAQLLLHGETASPGSSEEEPQRLSSIQVLYYLTPVSFAVLLPSWITFIYRLPASRLATDTSFMLASIAWVLAGAGMAFLLDLFNLLMIAVSSALSSSVAGCAKTALLVLFSWLFFRNQITALNIVGYSICVTGVVWYNVVKYRRLVQIQSSLLPSTDREEVDLDLNSVESGSDVDESPRVSVGKRDTDNRMKQESSTMGIVALVDRQEHGMRRHKF